VSFFIKIKRDKRKESREAIIFESEW